MKPGEILAAEGTISLNAGATATLESWRETGSPQAQPSGLNLDSVVRCP